MKKNLYFVVSLPRSGTTSLCKMAEICGLKSLHCLLNNSFVDILCLNYNFFADTPFYSPEFICGILESNIPTKYRINFIYSHRKIKEHVNSIEKLLSVWKKEESNIDKKSLLDNLLYKDIIKNIDNHYSYIKDISEIYKIALLDYYFDDGWDSFCEFICLRPKIECEIPHLNKSQNLT